MHLCYNGAMANKQGGWSVNEYHTQGDTTMIEVSRKGIGYVGTILVDTLYKENLSKYRWRITTDGYVAAKVDGVDTHIHRLLLPSSSNVDHINRNTLDNRLSNLRPATKRENAGNMFRNKQNTSGYKGICFNKRNKNWIAQIKLNYKAIWLGAYQTKEEAALAYDIAAIQIFGDFALLNIIGVKNV